MAESIGKSGIEQRCEFFAFFVGKARIATVGLGIFQVDFLVSHIEVAAHYHRFLGIELEEIVAEIVFPRHSIVESAQFVLRVWHIHRHKEEIGHFERNHAALVVVIIDADAVGYAERRMASENCSS